MIRTATIAFTMLAVAALAGPSGAAGAARRPSAPPSASGASLLDVELFQVDEVHSSIEFEVPWMALTRVKGTFAGFSGTIAFDSTDIAGSSITIVLRVPTITTNNERRDKHLRSADFFDAEKYPTATFTSRTIDRTPNGYRMRGPLTIHGVTKDIEVPFTYVGHEDDSDGAGHRLGFEGRFAIRRKDFGIVGPSAFNKTVAVDKVMIGEEVEIVLAIQGWRWTPEKPSDPQVDSLYRAVLDRGATGVARQYRAARASTPDSLMAVDEGVLNTLGFFLLQKRRIADAEVFFQLEEEAYPGTAFADVGLAQSYAMSGRRAEALASCEKALRSNPNATRAVEIQRRLAN